MDFRAELSKWGYNKGNAIDVEILIDEILPSLFFQKEEPKQETLKEVKDLAYYKANAEEDYLQVPISVLRYISQLEQEQDKNKYSEEDIKHAFFSGCQSERQIKPRVKCCEEFIEKFKNK